jgi:Polyketide cyclase / dehydrase and lipid transport
MATMRQQALVEAPIGAVWELISDPTRFPEWNEEIDVTGVPTRIEKGATFRHTASTRFGPKATTTFEVEEFDESLREIRLRCQTSGFYSHWFLTEARGDTFADVEMGVEPRGLKQRIWALPHTKTDLRRSLDLSLDGLRKALRRR